jgi:hypothetical protein
MFSKNKLQYNSYESPQRSIIICLGIVPSIVNTLSIIIPKVLLVPHHNEKKTEQEVRSRFTTGWAPWRAHRTATHPTVVSITLGLVSVCFCKPSGYIQEHRSYATGLWLDGSEDRTWSAYGGWSSTVNFGCRRHKTGPMILTGVES